MGLIIWKAAFWLAVRLLNERRKFKADWKKGRDVALNFGHQKVLTPIKDESKGNGSPDPEKSEKEISKKDAEVEKPDGESKSNGRPAPETSEKEHSIKIAEGEKPEQAIEDAEGEKPEQAIEDAKGEKPE